MFSVRATPWHGLGAVLDRPPASIAEAIEAAGLGWSVIKKPLAVDLGSNLPDVCRYRKLLGHYVTARQDTDEELGVVGERYRIVQNHEAFAFIDQLLGSAIHFETAGSLHGGRRVWVLATLPEHIEVGGDAVRPYVLLMNSHDGSTAVVAATTPIRVVTGEMRISVCPELGSTRGRRIWDLGSGSGMSRPGCRCLASEAVFLLAQSVDVRANTGQTAYCLTCGASTRPVSAQGAARRPRQEHKRRNLARPFGTRKQARGWISLSLMLGTTSDGGVRPQKASHFRNAALRFD
jgi:hypothetical protein